MARPTCIGTSGSVLESGVAAPKDDGSRDILVRPDDQFGLNREPCVTKPTRDLARPTMVTINVDWTTLIALRRVPCLVTDVKADQYRTPWSQHSTELLEHAGHGVVGHVDHGPERDDAGDRVVRQVEVRHRPDLEAQTWIVAPREGDHLGREIDAEHVHSGVVEVAGDVPRPAANIGDRPASGAVHQLGEQRQARAEVRARTEQSTYLLGVPGRVGV